VTTQQVKDAWPQILDAVQKAKRSAWMVVFTAQVRSLSGDVLSLSFPSDNDVQSFRQPDAGGSLGVSEYLRQAIVDVLGIRVKFIARADSAGGSGGSPRPSAGAPTAPTAETWPGAEPSASPATAPATGEAARPAATPALREAPATRTEDTASVGAPAALVTEWATVSIPSTTAGPVAEVTTAAVATMERPAEPTPAAVERTAPSPAPATDEPPFDDVPPPETEPPFEPPVPDEPTDEWSDGPAAPARAAAPAAQPAAAQPAASRASRPTATPAAGSRTPTFQQPQRYGEAVVREILGATFIEEQPAPPTPGMR
jgi:DNA polymerase-3 subunit gamma/tau